MIMCFFFFIYFLPLDDNTKHDITLTGAEAAFTLVSLVISISNRERFQVYLGRPALSIKLSYHSEDKKLPVWQIPH